MEGQVELQPFSSLRDDMASFSETFDFNFRRDRQFPNDRRDYESVDEKSLSEAMSQKTTKKKIHEVKGRGKLKPSKRDVFIQICNAEVWLKQITKPGWFPINVNRKCWFRETM